MFRKLLPFILVILFQITKAQNEFITIWQPGIVSTPTVNVNAPFQANANQIWFPGIGQNYTISWEEVGFPQHNGVMTNVTSANQVLIDFGTPTKEDAGGATYRVKVSNGNGVFQQIKFASYQSLGPVDVLLPNLQMQGSADKLLSIEQWGNIQWTSMNAAFANCQRVVLNATDSPDLSNVTNAALMFYRTSSFSGADSMQNWNTSTIQNFSFMFALQYIPGQIYVPDNNTFNPPNLNNWNMSSATDLSYMFAARTSLNQNLNSWNVSNVKNMAWLFALCQNFNHPLDSWNTSNLEDIHYIFFSASLFNQPLNTWNTSKVKNLNNAFSQTPSFNQPLDLWNVSNVTKMNSVFANASAFNQSLASWNIASLVFANGAFANSAIDCENYSRTLAAWADHPNTPNNVNFSQIHLMQYAANVSAKRDILINKGWTITGDSVGSCLLSASEVKAPVTASIYPNPATDHIFVENVKNIKHYKIYEMSGRLVSEGNTKLNRINISGLSKGNYLLQLDIDGKLINFKFIKK